MTREQLKALLELIKDRSDRALQAIDTSNIPTYVLIAYFETETKINLETLK